MIQRLTVNALLLVQRYMPVPYLFALLLTFIAAILALFITHTPVEALAGYWYGGLWEILTFTMQMILVLLCGHALVDAPLIRRGIAWVCGRPRTERQAGIIVFLAGWATALFNWGFCLVVVGVLVREIPRRLPGVSRGYLAAAGYTGFAVWGSGLSSSVALVSATPGSPLNIIESMSGRLLSLQDMLLTPYNIFGVVGMLVVMPLLFGIIKPPASERDREAPAVPAQPLDAASEESAPPTPPTPAERIERSPWITVLLALLCGVYLFSRIRSGTFSMDFNMMIFLLLALGWVLHGTPIRYMRAFHEGGRAAGPLALAYPLYGGILGLIRDSGLADWFAQLFVSFSTAYTLPFWSYVASNILNMFVPSGGGHWAVQGPVMVKAALELEASLPKTAMAVAFGDQVANLLQPFWALPIVSIAGINIREMMGYCLLALGIAFPLFGLALLVF